MSFQKSTRALKNEVLDICGELIDGTSDFETSTLRYLNNVYQGLLSGGNEFGVDVSEPWVWAQSKRPMLLSIMPNYNGVATLANNSLVGSLSIAPAYSLEGWYLRATNRSDVYRIVKHDAGTTSISLDQPYLEGSGSLNFTAYKLDYDLVDGVVVIDSSNNKLDFKDASMSSVTATVPRGSYLPADLCLAIKSAMELVGSTTYTVSFNDLTRKFSIATDGVSLDLLFATGPNAEISISSAIGFDLEDQKSKTSYLSAYAQSGVMRLTKPIQTYRSGSSTGQIYMVDDLSDESNGSVTQGIPDKFAIVDQKPSGLWKIRFNAAVYDTNVRAEVSYIPTARKLVDSDLSFPLVPLPHADYLIYAAASFVLADKSDAKSDSYKALAMAKLQAMVNDNRKNAVASGNNYGRIIPRSSSVRRLGYF